MGILKYTCVFLLALISICSAGKAWARQNIVIGELSVGYNFQDRTYKDSGTTDDQADDTRDLYASPRMRLSSRGASDFLAFTYAPTFTYDDIDGSNDVGHDLNLLAEKNINRDWLVRATNSYFYGQDSSTDNEQRSSPIIPGEVTPSTPAAPGVERPESDIPQLTEKYGRRKYWRNDFGLSTDYTYARDSIVGAGYNFGMLRNVDGDADSDGATGDYSDYDRHEWVGRLSYRFNIHWNAESEVSYVKGTDDENNTGTTDNLNDNLEEYHGSLRLNYNWRPHDNFFGKYSYAETVYEDTTQENSTIHEATFGWDHDFSRRLRMTLSAGPTLVTYENKSSETGYNSFAGLVYTFKHSALTANTSYNYEFDNFDGEESGLSKVWRSDLGFSHRFTPHLQTTISTGYTKSDSEQPGDVTIFQEDDSFAYTEETYDTGLVVSYSFLRWYTLSASYRYSEYQSDYDDDYDEHRVMLTLTAAKELFRW